LVGEARSHRQTEPCDGSRLALTTGKFASDNDEMPPAQLMAPGGWRSYKKVVEIYQAPHLDKLRHALEYRAEQRKLSFLAPTTTTNDNQQTRSPNGPLLELGAVG